MLVWVFYSNLTTTHAAMPLVVFTLEVPLSCVSTQIWPVCNNGITFYLPSTHKPYLPLLPSREASTTLWLLLNCTYPQRDGQAELKWSHTEINVPHWEWNPCTVTHPGTNRARRRVTSLMCTTPILLGQATTTFLCCYWACGFCGL